MSRTALIGLAGAVLAATSWDRELQFGSPRFTNPTARGAEPQTDEQITRATTAAELKRKRKAHKRLTTKA